MDELWISTSEGRYQVIDALGHSHDTVEPLNLNIDAAVKVNANHRPGVGPVTDRKRVEAIVAAALSITKATPQMSDWSFLGFELAKRGIGSDVEEIITNDYERDSWRPEPNAQAVTVTLDLGDASKLADILMESWRGITEEDTHAD